MCPDEPSSDLPAELPPGMSRTAAAPVQFFPLSDIFSLASLKARRMTAESHRSEAFF